MPTPAELLEATESQLSTLDYDDESPGAMDRRHFMFFSLVSAAATTLGMAATLRAQGALTAVPAQLPQPAPIPLGNGEAPALQFQPYPAGTGALMERLVKERGHAAFERAAFAPVKWSGVVPTAPEAIAYLPAHRLSALIRARKITSMQLTDLYLTRLKRLNPTLLCAVTIMEQQARAEAARADAEISAGRYRGPLHGLPYGVKDLFSTKGVPTTWGAADFENQIIDEDAEIVVRL
ncbi:MAG: amidase family protein, partial [Gemmatimonadaceae bacterium]